MVPLSVLGDLRRRLLETLEQKVDFKRTHRCTEAEVWSAMVKDVLEKSNSSKLHSVPSLHVLCRSLAQIDAALQNDIHDVYAEFHDIRQYKEAVEKVHSAGGRITLAPLRIQKPGEMGLMKSLIKRGADQWLVRNLATLQFAQEHNIEMVGDFSLNVTNPLTADWFLSKGLRRITASYDLNRDQLLDLVKWLPAENLEVVIHQHMPMFHMEHCVFCTVLSPGNKQVKLRSPLRSP